MTGYRGALFYGEADSDPPPSGCWDGATRSWVVGFGGHLFVPQWLRDWELTTVEALRATFCATRRLRRIGIRLSIGYVGLNSMDRNPPFRELLSRLLGERWILLGR